MRKLILVFPLCLMTCMNSSKLEKRERCARVGRAFYEKIEKEREGDRLTTIGYVVYAYNSDADTCLCKYEIFFMTKPMTHQGNVVDTLTNKTVASYDTAYPDPDHKDSKRYEAVVMAMVEDRPIPPESK